MMSRFIPVAYLLATGGGGRGGRTASFSKSSRGGGRNNNGRDAATAGGRGGIGRNRYTRDGIKKRPSSSSDGEFKQEELHPLPPLTIPNGPRPSYYTCRHNYESTLIDETNRYAGILGGEVLASSPYPGLVRVEDDNDVLPTLYDPVYALQSIPQCTVVTAESIKGIAREVMNVLMLGDDNDSSIIDTQSKKQRERLHLAERGSLSIHNLVPGMCKGQANPIMQHRSQKIGEELSKMLKKNYPAARKASVDENGNRILPKERWTLQVMLQSPTIAVASLMECHHVGPGKNAFWPNVVHPLGLAKVDIEDQMPSSAYRKLMEGIECMGICPKPTATVVDLGACPGGWTSVMRRYFNCRVIAVDRSELDATLMKDKMVDFVKGDAFTFEPPDMGEESWMISDVIAYPDRVTELLSRWCENKWASNMIVTMKFQGTEPDLDQLDKAVRLVEDYGYSCRVKHFFNNKNEVTFMVSENDMLKASDDLEIGVVGTPMFPGL